MSTSCCIPQLPGQNLFELQQRSSGALHENPDTKKDLLHHILANKMVYSGHSYGPRPERNVKISELIRRATDVTSDEVFS